MSKTVSSSRAASSTAPISLKHLVKRDGRKVIFKMDKIARAVGKAFEVTGEGTSKDAERVGKKVFALLEKQARAYHKSTHKNFIPTIEDVQDCVEKVLMILDFEETAKAYILYREQRRQNREAETAFDSAVSLVDKYLGNLDWVVKENANMAYSLQGLNNYICSAISTKYWMNRIYPAAIREAHESGDLHIHDLQLIAAYCCGWDLQDLLRRGFTGVPGKVACKPAKHLGAILGQMVNFIYTLQGEVAGAQAFSSFDTLLAPFVRYDKLSYERVKQEIQSFVFNMNVATRVGFQTPFSNITMDINPPALLAQEHVIIGGEPQAETYADFPKEMAMINRAFAEVMTEGDASGRIFTFPIPTYNITKDFDWDDKSFDPVWEMTIKYGIPYFANFVNSDMHPDDARSMCCRLRLDNRELRKRGGGLFGANPLTGSIGVVTINLPRLGYLAKTEKEFFTRLDHQMDLAKNSLELKRSVVDRLTEAGLYPYTKFYLASIKERFGTYWKNHFSTIGLIGTNEAVQNLFGADTTITTPKGHAFAQKTLNHMRKRLERYQKETGNLYNLEATPAEGTAYRLALLDKKHYPAIIVANEGSVNETQTAPYYTNSSHIPVGHTNDIFEALNLQDDLQTLYTGGTVLHGFLGERINTINTAKQLVRRISEKYRLPYFTLTPTFSICAEHGYLTGEQSECPHCGRAAEVYSRVVGYIRPVAQWNNGKHAEYDDRNEYHAATSLASKHAVTVKKK
ncbi:MAG: ribonucleoside triphosphate reductase [Candidatus Moraniibacteriota bacterium]